MPLWTRRPLEFWRLVGLLALVGLFLGGMAGTAAAEPKPKINFDMVRSAAAANANCLSGASGHVTVTSRGPVEVMAVEVDGLPPNTEFDFFVIQLPNAPFGLAWYQGDIETNDEGEGQGLFSSIGVFGTSIGIFATGNQLATEPIHMLHLGLWFGSPEAAAGAGCPGTVTRFNGDHTAGIQALSTRNFPDLEGPLRQLE